MSFAFASLASLPGTALKVYAAPIVPQPGERVEVLLQSTASSLVSASCHVEEVEYEGQCYVGILYGVDNGMASVRPARLWSGQGEHAQPEV